MNQQAPSFFEGYRVLDLCDKEGAYGGSVLGGFGADVIYMEKPGGNPLRQIGPFYHDNVDPEMSLFHWFYNTNKRGITLDIERPKGQDIFRELVKSADLVMESFPPGYMDGLGLGYSSLSKINPGLVMVSITPFGQTGPYKDYKASDLIAVAMGGQMWPMGEPKKPPVRFTAEQAYLQAGIQAATASVIALYHRDLTGEGQYIDVSMQEAIETTTWILHQHWSQAHLILNRYGREIQLGTGNSLTSWPCKDGAFSWTVYTGAVGAQTRRMVEWMDSEGVAEDLAEVNWEETDMAMVPKEQRKHWEEVCERFLLTKTKRELDERAIKDGIWLFVANTPEDLVTDAQLNARNFWVPVDVPKSEEKVLYPYIPLKTSELTFELKRAPLIGEHNLDIYKGELGMSESEISQLKERNII